MHPRRCVAKVTLIAKCLPQDQLKCRMDDAESFEPMLIQNMKLQFGTFEREFSLRPPQTKKWSPNSSRIIVVSENGQNKSFEKIVARI